MVIECKFCKTTMFSTYQDPYQECECGSVMIDGIYNDDGKLILDRYGWPDGDPDDWINFLGGKNELVS